MPGDPPLLETYRSPLGPIARPVGKLSSSSAITVRVPSGATRISAPGTAAR